MKCGYLSLSSCSHNWPYSLLPIFSRLVWNFEIQASTSIKNTFKILIFYCWTCLVLHLTRHTKTQLSGSAIFSLSSLSLFSFSSVLLFLLPPPPLRLSFAVNLCLRLCFSIPSHPLPLRGPDLAHENMVEWGRSAGKGLLMQTPLGSIHWTSSTYHRCDSFHLTVNFS